MSAFVSAIIVAAGGSTRMGTADSKQFVPLLGQPAILYTLRAFQACALISEVVVVCRAQDMARIEALARENGISKLTAVTEGGDCRAASVQNGILAVSAQAQYFAIHDGARPLITPEEITAVTEAAFETGAATLGTAVTDTIKIADENNVILQTLTDAEDLSIVTDDCSLIENMGGEVQIVEGSRENIKLTTPVDVVLAESILSRRGEA